ncbi:MAG: type I 3-dehydroquinate dehydratase [Eubacterium sp.]|jgi:3-dehydroquinate dehydratase-1|nr:type I 3-dehydroquinate dehydratase [Eubacterium sp.]
MNPLTIKNLTIGEGRPKICVPITGATEKEILKEIDSPDIIYADLIEWRADCFLNVLQNEKLDETLTLLQTKQKNAPILFTCRTKEEGGSASISPKEYEALNDFVLSTKKPDLIDIQAYQQGTDIPKLIQTAKKQGIKVIASYHNFNQTPSKKEIIDRLRHMQNLGADLIKIAVMPQDPKDVLTLLLATEEMNRLYANVPIITMSMSKIGEISRISGETFGSAITFASIGTPSAPGQLKAKDLAKILSIINKKPET